MAQVMQWPPAIHNLYKDSEVKISICTVHGKIVWSGKTSFAKFYMTNTSLSNQLQLYMQLIHQYVIPPIDSVHQFLSHQNFPTYGNWLSQLQTARFEIQKLRMSLFINTGATFILWLFSLFIATTHQILISIGLEIRVVNEIREK